MVLPVTDPPNMPLPTKVYTSKIALSAGTAEFIIRKAAHLQ